ncbi:probable cleavage and polyadenylation specificity factor subunit 2 [Halyomorpha halys]|uniref:probable cleavage and polyadenylation specificity factor subunit 2 n=1 Tax=Halyomorpha halys TaxID=286706 RepID=UPI0006D4EB78|nr:probable cleavage and polyadenylation specificity factor subunit 2 [Halyomorpha halys]
MTSIIKFHALSGVMDESPPCYILQVDEFRFLLDCGWDEHFNQDYIKELKRHVHLIDAVLLTYPDHLHLGALPYLVGKCGLSCPVYATIPVYKMGQMFMYDLYQSRYNMEDFNVFSLDDVDAAFDKVVQLKYNQSVTMKGKCYGLSIVPMPAGHMIGGTMWKIMKTGEEDIIYAIDFNHKKERHLNGCDLERLQRPSLLITDAFNATYQQERRRARDEKLMTTILQTLSNNGNILIAVDTAGRLLELAHMLDQLWRNKNSGLQIHPLCLINNVSYNVVEFAKSQIEWMSDKLMKSFEAVRNNPFQFKHIRLCHSVSELNKIPSAKVVLASMPDLECGFAREIFFQWASDSKNSIVLTSRCCEGTLARDLLDNGVGRTIQITVKKRVRLEGEELKEYLKAHKKTNDKNEEKESSESEDEIQLLSVTKGSHDLVIKQERRKKNQKSLKKFYPMFPFIDRKVKFDEYGEFVRIEDYKAPDTAKRPPEKKSKKKDDDIIDPADIPTKCVSYEKSLTVNAQVQYIDFEGRSDGESVQKIITQLRPRRVILVRGTTENTEALEKHLQQWSEAKIFCPKKGDIVDATTESHIYQIRLTDSLVSSLHMQKGKDSELAWIDAITKFRQKPSDTMQSAEEMEVEDDGNYTIYNDDYLTLEPLPLTEVNPHQAVFINELKLSDLKQILSRNGIESEFSGGVLWCCNGTIAIRRLESSKVYLEGWISENYYRIREILYGQYAIL